jgi:hypothetical protein
LLFRNDLIVLEPLKPGWRRTGVNLAFKVQVRALNQPTRRNITGDIDLNLGRIVDDEFSRCGDREKDGIGGNTQYLRLMIILLHRNI